MSDVGFALEAKSDQLNAIDIMGVEPVIKIREVKVTKGEQSVWVYFDGDNNRPWKPSKGMLRILAGAWGRESVAWIGRQAQIYFEPSVIYAGKPVGGIRIRALSDIDPKGLQFSLTISRTKREPYFVPLLEIVAKEYPVDAFNKALPTMVKMMGAGEMTLQQVIARCQETGTLTDYQIKQLEASAPVIIDDDQPKVDNLDALDETE